jgi:hypothetical protein
VIIYLFAHPFWHNRKLFADFIQYCPVPVDGANARFMWGTFIQLKGFGHRWIPNFLIYLIFIFEVLNFFDGKGCENFLRLIGEGCEMMSDQGEVQLSKIQVGAKKKSLKISS